MYNIDVETLKENSNHKIYNCIISDEDNVDVEFKITNNGQSSSILDLDKHKKYYPHIVIVDKIKGKTKTLKTLINEHNIDITKYNFINIDLQGVELRAIKGLGELLTNIDYIYTEVNCASVYKDNDLIDDIDSYLKQYGFLRKETHWSDAEWGDALYIKEIKTTQIGTEIRLNLEQINALASQLNTQFGQTRERIGEIEGTLRSVEPYFNTLGATANEVAKIISEVSLNSRKNVIASSDSLKELLETSKVLGQSPEEFIGPLTDVGIQFGQVQENLKGSVDYVRSIPKMLDQVALMTCVSLPIIKVNT